MRNEEEMKKKRISSLMIVLLVLTSLAISLTSAFTMREIETENIVTFGNLKMKILETELNANGEEQVFNLDEETNIGSNPNVSRIVRVENIGKEPMFVRISLNMEGLNQDGEEISDAGEVTEYEINEEDWVYRDGWYYYKKVLEPDAKSDELMTEILFNSDKLVEKYSGADFKLHVTAQAVQSKNNAAEVLEAKGWPKEVEHE